MNLKLLAQTLGISESTASRALNGFPEVSERTRERVLAVAKTYGYRPHPAARNLAVGRTNVVGIIYPVSPPDLGDSLFLDVVGGMADALEQQQMELVIIPVSPDHEFQSYERIARGGRVDGLVVSRTRLLDERVAYLSKMGMPFVAHGRTELEQTYAWFDYDNASGMRLAVEHLRSLRHRRMGFIGGPSDLTCTRQRLEVLLGESGVTLDVAHIVTGALDNRAGYMAMQTILTSRPWPSAVVIDNHLSAAGSIRALLDAGIKLGREMSVIVWGKPADMPEGLRLTIIDNPKPRQAGAKIINLLLALRNGMSPEELHELWQPALLIGDSTGICLD